MDQSLGIAFGGFWATIHLLRAMVNRGLVSPNELEEIYGSLIEGLQASGPDLASKLEVQLEPIFVEMRGFAHDRWIGKGQTDPD